MVSILFSKVNSLISQKRIILCVLCYGKAILLVQDSVHNFSISGTSTTYSTIQGVTKDFKAMYFMFHIYIAQITAWLSASSWIFSNYFPVTKVCNYFKAFVASRLATVTIISQICVFIFIFMCIERFFFYGFFQVYKLVRYVFYTTLSKELTKFTSWKSELWIVKLT